MRVWVDENACAGTGLCEMTCPEVFEVDLVSKVRVEVPPSAIEDLVREAADDCPTEAIHIEEAP